MCAFSVKEFANAVIMVRRKWISCGTPAAGNSVTEQISRNEASDEGIFEHGAKTDVVASSTSRISLKDPCVGGLYPTPSEGKLAHAKVSGTEFDMFIYDHSSVRDIVSHSIKTSGSWELQDTQKLMNLMTCPASECQNRVFMDIGANVGWYSLTALSMGFFEASGGVPDRLLR